MGGGQANVDAKQIDAKHSRTPGPVGGAHPDRFAPAPGSRRRRIFSCWPASWLPSFSPSPVLWYQPFCSGQCPTSCPHRLAPRQQQMPARKGPPGCPAPAHRERAGRSQTPTALNYLEVL